MYVDSAISNSVGESSFIRTDLDENLKLDKHESITINSTLTWPKPKIELPAKAYVDSLSQNDRKRRNMSTSFSYHDIQSANKELTKLDIISVNGSPTPDGEPSTKKYIDDDLFKNTSLRFIETIQNCLKKSTGIDIYKLT